MAIADTAFDIIGALRQSHGDGLLDERRIPELRLELRDPRARSGEYESFTWLIEEERPFRLCGKTLHDMAKESQDDSVGFDFDAVVANNRLDLGRLCDIGVFTEERPALLGVFDSRRRISQKKAASRLLARDLPVESLVRFSDDIWFASPELAIIQMAATHDVLSLALAIMELCGTYATNPALHVQGGDESWGTAYDVRPVMSRLSLIAMMEHVRFARGRKKLEQALRLSYEGAASPAEARLALIMALPPDNGGYSIGDLSLNARLEAPKDRAGRLGQTAFSLDALVLAGMADLEYESVEFHLDPVRNMLKPAFEAWRKEETTKADQDRRRARDLGTLGIKVIPVTKFDLRSVSRMDQVVWALASCIADHQGIDADEFMEARLAPECREARRLLLERLNGA